jgi:hypothetical protein
MPARAWILIFALAGGGISLAIAVAGALGSTVWVVILAGVGFVLTLLGAVVAYHYARMSEWDSAALSEELEAKSMAGGWLTGNRAPYASDRPEDVRSAPAKDQPAN